MTTHNREVWIDAPKEKVWEVLADFGNIYQFNPIIPTSYLTSEQEQGVGTTRHCDFSGGSIEERIIEWTEGQSMQIEIYDGQNSPPFKTAVATITVEEKDGGTLVKGSLNYEMKYGPVGALMDKMMVTPRFGQGWSGLFAGLKKYIETGETIPSLKAVNLDAVAVVA